MKPCRRWISHSASSQVDNFGWAIVGPTLVKYRAMVGQKRFPNVHYDMDFDEICQRRPNCDWRRGMAASWCSMMETQIPWDGAKKFFFPEHEAHWTNLNKNDRLYSNTLWWQAPSPAESKQWFPTIIPADLPMGYLNEKVCTQYNGKNITNTAIK